MSLRSTALAAGISVAIGGTVVGGFGLTDAAQPKASGNVEWSYFGEHPAVRDDYAACRASFATLAQELHGAVAA